MKRLAPALAALVALLIVPALSDALACMDARECALAPCCVDGARACPMHQSGSQPGCRAHSCRDDRSAEQAPTVVPPVTITISRVQTRTAVALRPWAAYVPSDLTPPDPPPPRLSLL